MIDLARHIEILLLDNDCVIVPDFGGFIAHYQPARYVKEENLYLPPVRTIGFNPQLVMNDGLLVQSYMQAHQTDFPDATRIIGKEVQELKETLYKEGHAEIHGLGILHCNIHNTYEFRPNEDGVLSPALYGLSSFSINYLKEKSSTVTLGQEILLKPLSKKRKTYINRRWLGNAVAVAAAVILFFFLSVPVENTYVDNGNYASLGTDGLFDAIRSQSLATTLVAVPAKQQDTKKTVTQVPVKKAVATSTEPKSLKPVAVRVEKVAAPKVEVKKETPKTEEANVKPAVVAAKPVPTKEQPAVPAKNETATGKQKYYIVVASLATAADAQQSLNSFKQKGFNDASIIEGNGRYRLSLCGFADQAAAYKKLNELKQSETYKTAWVLNSK